MKQSFALFAFFFLALTLCQSGLAQTYTLSTNGETWTALTGASASNCDKCTINIPAGWTLNLSTAGKCNGCTFNNGTVNISHSFTFGISADNSVITTTFNSDTLLVTVTTTFNNVAFNNDSVSATAAITTQNSTATATNSRLYLDGAVKFNSATLTNDSIHINANLTFSNTPGDFIGSHITVSSGTVTSQGSNFTNSVLDFTGSSKFSSNNTLALSGTSLYLDGSSAVNKTAYLTTSNSNIVMAGGSTSNIFKVDNGFPLTNSTLTMNGVSSISSPSFTATGSTVTMNGTASIPLTNTFDVNNSHVYLNGNSTASGVPVTLENNSSVTIGDGSIGSSASMSTHNALNMADNSTIQIANQNNSFQSNVSSFSTSSGSYNISSNTISCNQGTTTGYAHNCKTNVVYGCGTLNKTGAMQCTTLAVADLKLSAAPGSPGTVLLSWQDEVEITAGYYQVLRNSGDNNWTAIGTVAITGNNNNEYQFKDASAPDGTDEYRLVRIDPDGNAVNSNITTIKNSRTIATIRLYPNPVTGRTFFLAAPTTGEIMVTIYTLTGQHLLQAALKGQTLYTLRLPSSLSGGMTAVVQVISPTGTQAFPLLVR